ncbi:MAG: 2OG-Fe(II) oxygenase [Gemmatimonadaceae bacterium]
MPAVPATSQRGIQKDVVRSMIPSAPIAPRLARLDWGAIERDLWQRGYAETPPVLTAEECGALVALYDDEDRFRSRVDMARHRFGEGEYKYFAAPLPRLVAELREHAYPHLAPIANRWAEALDRDDRFPPALAEFLTRCAKAGQTRPTPLLLRYQTGGYNCLHQDIYGDIAFPMQLLCFLDRPGVDYTGGEFLLVEQRPRAQSAAEVIAGAQGALVFFTTRERPARGARGFYRVNVRHGVSRVRSGLRNTLGVIFHDAR